MIMPSKRSVQIKPQPMFDILGKAQAIERSGRTVIHLEIGDTKAFVNTEIRALLENSLKRSSLGYSPSAGEEDLRSALASLYAAEKGVPFRSEHVAISPANALIVQALAVICDEGDEILVPDPGFPTYSLAAEFNKLKPIYYKLHQERGWNPCPDEVGALLDRGARAVILNSPSNPLGVVLDAKVLSTILDLANRRGVVCLLDETYRNLVYGAGSTDAIEHRANCLYLFSLSKEAAAPGLRVGGIIGEESIIKRVCDYNSMFFSCQPDFIQKAAASYIKGGSGFCEEIRTHMPARIACVDEILSRCPQLSYIVPNAAFYFYVNIGRTGVRADDFANRLLTQHRVAVCPGTCFGPAGEKYIRLSIAGPERDVIEGCSRLVRFVEGLHPAGSTGVDNL